MPFKGSTSKLGTFLLAGTLAGAINLMLEAVLLRHGVPSLGVLLVSNLITGVAGGTLILHLKIVQQERRQVVEDRLRKLADMNHHVRNALAMVAFYGTRGAAVWIVKDEVGRSLWKRRAAKSRLGKTPGRFPLSHKLGYGEISCEARQRRQFPKRGSELGELWHSNEPEACVQEQCE